jgi:hypothetical protein
MYCLGYSLVDIGRHREALELREKTLEARRRTLGEEHPDTLQSMKSLGDRLGDSHDDQA